MSEVIAKEHLIQFISRIERLEIEKADLAEDIKEIYAEAKATGFDTKIMKQIIKLKKLDKAKLAEEEAILELYMQALDL
ncbi:MAG: DUF2312 domain-containing protein [Rickettsiaceae bacterium]|nr:MAG: DUF2312 domain-containing protein [Rickettsiaceae bacterium]